MKKPKYQNAIIMTDGDHHHASFIYKKKNISFVRRAHTLFLTSLFHHTTHLQFRLDCDFDAGHILMNRPY